MLSESRKRRDGLETRSRILDAACDVFSDKGYRDTTLAEICDLAQTNCASVKYHFGDKAALYEEVWRACVREAVSDYPIDGGVPETAPAEDRLRGHIRALIERITDDGKFGRLHRLNLLEMARPTPFMQKLIGELRQPHFEYISRTLKELLGPEATAAEVTWCEMSIIGQCRMTRSGIPDRFPDLICQEAGAERQQFTGHVIEFTLAGVCELRRRIAARGRKKGSRRPSPYYSS